MKTHTWICRIFALYMSYHIPSPNEIKRKQEVINNYIILRDTRFFSDEERDYRFLKNKLEDVIANRHDLKKEYWEVYYNKLKQEVKEL